MNQGDIDQQSLAGACQQEHMVRVQTCTAFQLMWKIFKLLTASVNFTVVAPKIRKCLAGCVSLGSLAI